MTSGVFEVTPKVACVFLPELLFGHWLIVWRDSHQDLLIIAKSHNICYLHYKNIEKIVNIFASQASVPFEVEIDGLFL